MLPGDHLQAYCQTCERQTDHQVTIDGTTAVCTEH